MVVAVEPLRVVGRRGDQRNVEGVKRAARRRERRRIADADQAWLIKILGGEGGGPDDSFFMASNMARENGNAVMTSKSKRFQAIYAKRRNIISVSRLFDLLRW